METLNEEKASIKAIIRNAGAFIAWVVGSGFATGQEILQFFTSYGYVSYGIILINLAGFIFISRVLLLNGYEHRNEEKFDHYRFYCGNKLGLVYTWFVPAALVIALAVLTAASGATMSEYFGVNRLIGSSVMSVLVLCVYLSGFENLIKIISKIGPVVVFFIILIGIITIINDFPNIGKIGEYERVLSPMQAAPSWIISSVLYLSLNFVNGSPFFTALGKTAKNQSDAKWGALVGAIALILVITVVNSSVLLNAGDAASLSVPTLYLARRISYAFGLAFSIVLMLGVFSSCSALMWSFCNHFFPGTRKNKIIAVATSVVTLAIGLFPFQVLVAVLYPIIGYMGLVFLALVVYKGIKKA